MSSIYQVCVYHPLRIQTQTIRLSYFPVSGMCDELLEDLAPSLAVDLSLSKYIFISMQAYRIRVRHVHFRSHRRRRSATCWGCRCSSHCRPPPRCRQIEPVHTRRCAPMNQRQQHAPPPTTTLQWSLRCQLQINDQSYIYHANSTNYR